MKRLAPMVVLAALAACGPRPILTPEPILAPLEVVIPVTGGCVPANMAAAPEYPDTDRALKEAPDAASRYQLIYAGRKVRSARLSELEPVVAGCPKAPAK